jgi:muramoyltetrapeptide carboxypeptidase
MRLPPPLAPGARVALVAPAGPLRGPDELERSVANARALGWEPTAGDHVLARHDYLGGSDRERLRDVNAALADDSVDAIWCVRGGYGAMRLLPHLDYASLTRRPRVLLGYSDVTALHAAIGTRCELVTYHGPTAREKLSGFSRDSLVRAVVERRDPLGKAEEARTIRSGRARGRLVGGNLALLSALAGTPYAPDYRGALLVLEDVGEPAYRIDRMLTQLLHSGALGQIAGIVAGHFTETTPGHELSARSLDVILREAADIAGVPAIAGAPIGHIGEQWTLPLGAMAELDADARSLHVETS